MTQRSFPVSLEDLLFKLIKLQRQVLDHEDEGERKVFNRMLDKQVMEISGKIVTYLERRLFFYGSNPVKTVLRSLPNLSVPRYYNYGFAYHNEDKMKDLIHRTQCLLDPENFKHPRLPPHKEYIVAL